jgi:hypothetical protein
MDISGGAARLGVRVTGWREVGVEFFDRAQLGKFLKLLEPIGDLGVETSSGYPVCTACCPRPKGVWCSHKPMIEEDHSLAAIYMLGYAAEILLKVALFFDFVAGRGPR